MTRTTQAHIRPPQRILARYCIALPAAVQAAVATTRAPHPNTPSLDCQQTALDRDSQPKPLACRSPINLLPARPYLPFPPVCPHAPQESVSPTIRRTQTNINLNNPSLAPLALPLPPHLEPLAILPPPIKISYGVSCKNRLPWSPH